MNDEIYLKLITDIIDNKEKLNKKSLMNIFKNNNVINEDIKVGNNNNNYLIANSLFIFYNKTFLVIADKNWTNFISRIQDEVIQIQSHNSFNMNTIKQMIFAENGREVYSLNNVSNKNIIKFYKHYQSEGETFAINVKKDINKNSLEEIENFNFTFDNSNSLFKNFHFNDNKGYFTIKNENVIFDKIIKDNITGEFTLLIERPEKIIEKHISTYMKLNPESDLIIENINKQILDITSIDGLNELMESLMLKYDIIFENNIEEITEVITKGIMAIENICECLESEDIILNNQNNKFNQLFNRASNIGLGYETIKDDETINQYNELINILGKYEKETIGQYLTPIIQYKTVFNNGEFYPVEWQNSDISKSIKHILKLKDYIKSNINTLDNYEPQINKKKLRIK